MHGKFAEEHPAPLRVGQPLRRNGRELLLLRQGSRQGFLLGREALQLLVHRGAGKFELTALRQQHRLSAFLFLLEIGELSFQLVLLLLLLAQLLQPRLGGIVPLLPGSGRRDNFSCQSGLFHQELLVRYVVLAGFGALLEPLHILLDRLDQFLFRLKRVKQSRCPLKLRILECKFGLLGLSLRPQGGQFLFLGR